MIDPVKYLFREQLDQVNYLLASTVLTLPTSKSAPAKSCGSIVTWLWFGL